MFVISRLIRTCLDSACDIIDEKEVETLGLIASPLEVPYCTFVDRAEYLTQLNPHVSMVITNESVAEALESNRHFGLCIVDNPRLIFFKLHNALRDNESYTRAKYVNKISPSAKISPLAVIADHNVTIGDNTIIEEFVVIRENTVIGNNCIIRSGVKLGGTDFEFKRDGETIIGVNHYGGVILGDNVEVQYNSGINKALYPWDNTIIGSYTKIDMLVHIAHGVKTGKACMIVANSGIGGRTVIGDNCWIGFGSTVKNGLTIGNNARVNMGAVVTKSVAAGEAVSGNFAIEHSRFLEHIKSLAR